MRPPVTFPPSEVHQSVIRRFETIVSSAGSSVAIRHVGRHTTYDSLNRAADIVARALTQRWGSNAEPVGLLLEHGERTVSAVLGALKAGKFYVPLDPSYPPDRLSFILKNCESRIVITDRQHASLAQSLAPRDCSVVTLETVEGDGGANPDLAIAPDAIAALFYTSGSTGQPKGVIQTHRLVLHRVMIDTNDPGIRPDDRLALLSSPSYSASLRPLFGALLNGAALCPFNLVDRGLTELAAWLDAERITIYASAPAVFRRLIGTLEAGAVFDSVRVIHLGADRVTTADFELFLRHFSPQCRFVTNLSSNETGQMRRFVAGKTTSVNDGVMPVGYAVPDKEILIVDEARRPLGPNQVGEIAVSSEFLSPGYWQQPALTAAAFRQDPADAKRQIYYTGDLGMLLPDGCLLYKGRKDSRVKIRGIGVELEEIEAALGLHPSIDRSAVAAREERSGQQALVAYIVAKPHVRLTVTDIRRFLSGSLPEYMVPSAVVFLDRLPLTPNGKINRLALPPPDRRRPETDAPYVAPEGRCERDLARVCESIIGVNPIGVRDNFFDLGADSLTLLQLTAQIEADFGRHLPPAVLFTSPTIAQLAPILRAESFPDRWFSLVPVQPSGRRPPFFWVHGACSTAFLARYLAPDQPFFGLEHQSWDGTLARYTEVDTIAASYLNEIRAIRSAGPYFIGGYSFGGIVALEMAQQLTDAGEHVALLALLDPPSLSGDDRGDSSAAESSNASMTDKVRRHMRHLSTLAVKEQLGYISRVIRNRVVNRYGLPVVTSVKALITRASLAMGGRLPVFARDAYIFDVCRDARRRYIARPYAGRVVLFQGIHRRYQSESDWPQMLIGDRETHLVNAEHLQMPHQGYIQLWADTLKGALSRAQAAGQRTAIEVLSHPGGKQRCVPVSLRSQGS